MKLGITDNPVEIQFAQNKIEDLCVNFEAMAPFLAPSSEELATDSARTQSMEGRDDPCKFWACEGLSSDRCEQYDKSWANWAVWLVQRHSTFAECVADCDCPIGETKYTASKEGQFLITCCDDATEEIRLNNFGTPEAIPDASTGGWKLECKPKCLAPECGKWYCKGGGIPGVNEVGCSQWTDGESTPPEGVDFYNDQSVCEQQSKCGKWWCNGSGICQPITQENPNPSSEENWGGAYFDDLTQCQNSGCGKYYCGLATQTDGNFLEGITAGCQKVDGTYGPQKPEGSTLFDEYENCMSSCGKWYCVAPPELGSEPISCSRVMSNTNPDSYSGSLFENKGSCHEYSGCSNDEKWICVDSLCQKFKENEVSAFDWNAGAFTYAQCRLAFDGCCPPENQYNPSTDQCTPV